MSVKEADSASEQAMLDELTFATAQTELLERDLATTRYRRDDLILDLLGTKASRKDISEAAGLAEISIYKIAARVRERRAVLEPALARKPRVRKKKVEAEVPVGEVRVRVPSLTEPVVVSMPEGVHPLMGWTLAAA